MAEVKKLKGEGHNLTRSLSGRGCATVLIAIICVVCVTVTVFKCGVMGPDCSTCQSVQVAPRTSKFGCQWCGDLCQHNSTCDRARLPTSSKCPLPVIESVTSSASSGLVVNNIGDIMIGEHTPCALVSTSSKGQICLLLFDN